MNISEEKLREFESALREIRDAALSDSKLFSDHELRKTFCWLSLGFSFATAVFCIAGHTLTGRGGRAEAMHSTLIFWAFIILLTIAGTIKITLISRTMARKNRTIVSLFRTIYGKGPANVVVAAIISICAFSVFFISVGLGTLMISLSAVLISFGLFSLDTRLRLPEFRALAWSLLALGLMTLFLVQNSPWLWGGLTWGGSFFVLGVAGLISMRAS
jgi:hypothetical protein